MNLTSQEEGVACFQNVARHLEPGGMFVIAPFTSDSTKHISVWEMPG